MLGGFAPPFKRFLVILANALAAVVRRGERNLRIDIALLGKRPPVVQRCCVVPSVECNIARVEVRLRALRSNDALEQSMIELLHYLTKSYRQLRRVARRLGANKHQIDSALAMNSKSKKAAIILFLLQLGDFAIRM